MKLFTRYNRINLFATVIVFLLSGISFYFLLRFVLIDQVDEDLKIEQHEIETYAAKYRQLPEIIPVKDQHIRYTRVNQEGGSRQFATLPAEHGGDSDIFRQLTFYITVNEQGYQVTVGKSLEGTDNMVQVIVALTLATILLILIISLFINRLLLRKLWQPFYDTLAAMRHFELGKKALPALPPTRIEEFIVMNETLRQATSKADLDYRYLKEFTENAAHELQTPLAIVQSKLDVLIQDEHLTEPQSRAVQAAYEAIQRLSRLNQALLLLTKIENGQYAETASINIAQKIAEKTTQFEEMIASKYIKVSATYEQPVNFTMNPILTDILLNNLFSNAIKYNLPGGNIAITADENTLSFTNTGAAAALDESRLFRRFSKQGSAKEGIGLGLAIIRQVAEVSGFGIHYHYQDQQHHFVLQKNVL
jgi:signal transduction histidine kinase